MQAILSSHFPQLTLSLDEEEDRLFLSDDELEACETSAQVREAAQRMLDVILPSIAMTLPYMPETGLGTEVREHQNGAPLKRNQFITVNSVFHNHSVVMTPVVSVNGLPRVPTLTPAERMRKAALADNEFAQASRRFYQAQHDIRQLYIVYEFVRDAVCARPKDWKKLVELRWATEEQLERFRETANKHHRHKPEPMDDPMTPEEARELIRNLLQHWANRVPLNSASATTGR